MNQPAPSATELSEFGLKLEDVQPKPFEVWPENWTAVRAFDALGSQWNVGFSGPTGLVYQSLPVVFELLKIPKKEWPDLFEDIRVMEAATLNSIRKK